MEDQHAKARAIAARMREIQEELQAAAATQPLGNADVEIRPLPQDNGGRHRGLRAEYDELQKQLGKLGRGLPEQEQ
jgi:hypothetical protein